MKDNMSLFIGILGIVITIFFYYKDNYYKKIQSEFWAYKTFMVEELIKQCRLRGCIYGIVIILTYVLLATNSIFDFLLIKGVNEDELFLSSILTMICMVLAQSICNRAIAFREFKSINEKINQGRTTYTELSEWSTWLCILVVIVGVFLFFIIEDTDHINNMIFMVGLLCIGIKAVHGSFLYTYIELRFNFCVDEITVKTKNDIYKNIYNYKLSKGYYKITYKKDKDLRCVVVPEREIYLIEKLVNQEKRLIDVYNELENK